MLVERTESERANWPSERPVSILLQIHDELFGYKCVSLDSKGRLFWRVQLRSVIECRRTLSPAAWNCALKGPD